MRGGRGGQGEGERRTGEEGKRVRKGKKRKGEGETVNVMSFLSDNSSGEGLVQTDHFYVM